MAATAIFLVLYLNSVSSVKASNCDAYQEIHLLANTSFSVNTFVKALHSELSASTGPGFHFLNSKARPCFSTAENSSSQLLLLLPVSSLCRRQGLLSIMLVDLVSLAPLP